MTEFSYTKYTDLLKKRKEIQEQIGYWNTIIYRGSLELTELQGQIQSVKYEINRCKRALAVNQNDVRASHDLWQFQSRLNSFIERQKEIQQNTAMNKAKVSEYKQQEKELNQKIKEQEKTVGFYEYMLSKYQAQSFARSEHNYSMSNMLEELDSTYRANPSYSLLCACNSYRNDIAQTKYQEYWCDQQIEKYKRLLAQAKKNQEQYK